MTYNSVFRLNLLLLMCLLACCKTAQGQGWASGSHWQSGNPVEPYASDGNYVGGLSAFLGDEVAAVINFPGEGAVYRIEGFELNKGFRYGADLSLPDDFHHLGRAIAHPGQDTFVVLQESLPFLGGNRSIFLSFFKLTSPGPGPGDGLFRQTQVFGATGVNAFAKTLLQAANGDYFVLGSSETDANPGVRDILLARLSAQGDLLWSNNYPGTANENAVEIVAGANGVLHILKTVNPAGQTWLMNIGPNGNLLNEFDLSGNGADTPAGLAATADGNLVLTGLNATGNLFLQKINTTGAALWRHDFTTPDQTVVPYGLLEDSNTDIVVVCTNTNLVTGEKDGFLMKFDAAGAPVWERRIGRTGRPEDLTKIRPCPDGGYLMGGKYVNQMSNHAYVVKTDVNGIVKPGRIFGNVFRDFDLDCSDTSGDEPIQNWLVRAYRDSTHVFYGSSDALGNYQIECDTGNYVLSLLLPNDYWEACTNNLPLSIGYLDTAVVDFAVQAVIDCPYMRVEHAMFNARPCDTTLIAIDYCNNGPADAGGAFLEVTLDSALTYLSADLPPASISGNVLTFSLGDVASADCGHLNIAVAVDCTVEIGQGICTEAHIYPDTICSPAEPLWSGAFVEVFAACAGDSVIFLLKNTGSGAMNAPLEYIVIEDAVLLHKGFFQLGPGGTMEVKTPSNGSTWHFMAGQEPGAPGNSVPVVAIEGCIGNMGDTISLGYFNQFPQNDADAFVSVFCIPATNSFDPNDKQASPAGFGPEHNIFANTDIEYMIRFQNTGTDTAFRVVLLDTLSAFLDPATFRPGASSHPYRFELAENGVVRFTFQPIALPHNSVDKAGSNGFVTFRIAQKRDNPVGTRIENRAGIYFDFNLPVITNTVFHTVHAPWLNLVSINQPDTAPKITFNVYPNPFAEQVTVQLEGEEIRNATLRLISTDGRVVREIPFLQNQLTLERGGLPAGMYFFSVEAGARVLGSGRVVAE